MLMKNFFLRKMMATQMKNVPKDQQEQILTLFEKNPELFMNLGKEIQEEMKKGKDQMSAAMEVMKRHEAELKALKE